MNWRDIPVRDWRLIHLNLVWLTAAMLFAGLTLLFTQGLLQYNQSQLQPLQTKLREARTAADAAQTGFQAVQENKQRYLELERRQVIGSAEHRLEWVESLTAAKRNDPLLKLTYQIDPQKVLEPSEAAGGSSLFSSHMNIKYAALHEEAFSRQHQNLRNLPGWLVAQRCSIERSKESGGRLAVDCDYHWLSIAPTPVAQPH